MAQAILAILLASAMVATLVGRRAAVGYGYQPDAESGCRCNGLRKWYYTIPDVLRVYPMFVRVKC